MFAKGVTKMDTRWKKRERLKETWRRTVEKEIWENILIWGTLQNITSDRSKWQALVAALFYHYHTKTLRELSN